MINRYTPSIHPAYLRLLGAHLSSEGVDLNALFSHTSLSWDELLERQRFISFEQFRSLASAAINGLERPWLGLEISSIIQVSSHGPLGYGALASKDGLTAFNLVEQMMPTRLLLYRFELKQVDEHCIFKIHEVLDTEELQEFIQVMLLGSFLDMLEKITGTKVDGADLVIRFPFDIPSWHQRYEQHFQNLDIHFSSPGFEIEMPSSLLSKPCLTADQFAYKNAVRECEALMQKQTVQLQPLPPDQVLLSSDQSTFADQIVNELAVSEMPFPGLECFAERFGMSSRTLIRKLKAEGVRYQDLVDEVRKDQATWALQNTHQSMDQIAESLGFIDTSNFSRVFRRWFACTPSEFRKRLQ